MKTSNENVKFILEQLKKINKSKGGMVSFNSEEIKTAKKILKELIEQNKGPSQN